MNDYTEIEKRIQEINPGLTDEVLGLLYEYFEARKNQKFLEFLVSERANDVLTSVMESYISKNYSASS